MPAARRILVLTSNGYAREWDYANAILLIDSSIVRDNRVGTSDDSNAAIAFGGGIHSENLNVVVRDSSVTNNEAAGCGGGISLGAGSAKLALREPRRGSVLGWHRCA
jgi:hypothetical protein